MGAGMRVLRGAFLVAAALALAAPAARAAVNIETVPVGNPGNAGELSGAGAGGYGASRVCGAVGYEYRIGKYEVTAGQYCEFLNAVAKTDTYGLYTMAMNYDYFAGPCGCNIKRSGTSGSYTYTVGSDWANRPVNHVSWSDAARFANWLHNGQPIGPQDLTTTEDGAYYLNGATTNAELISVTRETGWQWAIASEDEWYKAAYYNPLTGTYYDYATSTNTPPVSGEPFTDGGTDPGNRATYNNSGVFYNDPYHRSLVGEWENSISAYGTFDQTGNVREWTEAVDGQLAQARGGGFVYDPVGYLHAKNRMFQTYGYERTSSDIYVGFRVVQVPEPATLSLLALGGLAILRRRGR